MMPDKMTEDKLAIVYPSVASAWVLVRQEMLAVHKVQIRITEGLRTFTEQSQLYSLGRTRKQSGTWIVTDPKKVVTHARAGESLHQYGLAIDTCFMGSNPYVEGNGYRELSRILWSEFGRLCKKNGLEWGGDWLADKIDRPHAEMSFGLSIHDLQMIHEGGGVDEVWNKCNQLAICGRQVI